MSKGAPTPRAPYIHFGMVDVLQGDDRKSLLKASAVRREMTGLQVSPEALAVLDRHIRAVLAEVAKATLAEDRRRVDGIVMRRCIP